MGRPIKKKFFGNTNPSYYGSAPLGSGVGGEGVATVSVGTQTNAPVSTLTVTVSFSAPSIAGGVTATGIPVKTGNTVTSVTITDAGSGYTSAPTVTFTGTTMTQVGTATATLTSSRQDAITIISYISTASQSRTNGDIIKQESSRRYLVQNQDGRGICKLTTGTLTGGFMHIIATEWNSSTYYVTKLTANKATLYQRTSTGTGYTYATGAVAKWTIGNATGTVVSLNHTI